MTIQIYDTNDGAVTVSIMGRIDTSNYQQLQLAVNELDYSKGALVFDFKDVEYISSAGLRVLLAVRKKIGDGSFRIINVSSMVYDIFATTGFDSIMDISVAREDLATYINLSFKEILKIKAEKSADVLFVTHQGIDYTWEDLERCSQIAAADLSAHGVRKGTHVGICSANSANWIIAFLAVQKLGAIACLLNFNYKEHELADVSAVGDITHLCYGEIAGMTDPEAFLSRVQAMPDNKLTTFINIQSSVHYKDRLAEYPALVGLFDSKVEADDACVMIYTSGSTGKPKGVLLSAYNILNASGAMSNEIEIDANDKLCLILPLFHIFGMTAGLFCNALKNASILIPESTKTSVLLDAISTYQCTLFHSVPTMVLAVMNNQDFHPDKVKHLRCIILAGAPSTQAQLLKMQENFANAHFVGAYGLSEMAPISITGYHDPLERVIHTVGKPIQNIQIGIDHSNSGDPCDSTTPGEIIVEGFNLMSCYYKSALDVQSIDDNGWMHTGDLGFLDEDGYLHLTGRAKELIIRGGENIMPNEIAGVISQYSGVSDVKVLGIKDDFFGEVVGAGIVMQEGASLDEEDLIRFLSERLAKYKVPAYIFQYEQFPVLSNGKIDAVTLKKDMTARAAH